MYKSFTQRFRNININFKWGYEEEEEDGDDNYKRKVHKPHFRESLGNKVYNNLQKKKYADISDSDSDNE